LDIAQFFYEFKTPSPTGAAWCTPLSCPKRQFLLTKQYPKTLEFSVGGPTPIFSPFSSVAENMTLKKGQSLLYKVPYSMTPQCFILRPAEMYSVADMGNHEIDKSIIDTEYSLIAESASCDQSFRRAEYMKIIHGEYRHLLDPSLVAEVRYKTEH
jgi:hypothetical protein